VGHDGVRGGGPPPGAWSPRRPRIRPAPPPPIGQTFEIYQPPRTRQIVSAHVTEVGSRLVRGPVSSKPAASVAREDTILILDQTRGGDTLVVTSDASARVSRFDVMPWKQCRPGRK